ncbi:hypothetical protein CDEST_05171 [Colletotrichum destructivum]|uniref:Uncharacterized protein n=1 Tax=Colletotrichum destructivum TaxID=34406 RepID=A0AAX4I9U0_9PEZI|nr:hypothetical protein CDEST_05171 [Colletotrichum destructivum]
MHFFTATLSRQFRLVNPLPSLKLVSSKYVYRHISSYFVLEQFLQPKSPRQRHLASSITLRFVGAALTEEYGREWCGLSFKHSNTPPPPTEILDVRPVCCACHRKSGPLPPSSLSSPLHPSLIAYDRVVFRSPHSSVSFSRGYHS